MEATQFLIKPRNQTHQSVALGVVLRYDICDHNTGIRKEQLVAIEGEGSRSLESGAGPITSHSLQEDVYQRLRRLIFNRDLDHEVIRIRQLAEMFEVSPMPVREALRRLEADGLVTFTRNKSIAIFRPSPEEVKGIFEVRLQLEPFAGRRAAGRVSEASLAELDALCERLDDFTDGDKWRASNAEFHRIIMESCGIPKLASIVDNLWLTVEPYRRYYIHNKQLLKIAQDQHREIVRALRRNDGDEVERILEGHLISTLDAVLKGIEQAENSTEVAAK